MTIRYLPFTMVIYLWPVNSVVKPTILATACMCHFVNSVDTCAMGLHVIILATWPPECKIASHFHFPAGN